MMWRRAGLQQSDFQLAFVQALVNVGLHLHKPQFAPHAQPHLPQGLQRSGDGADASGLEVVRRNGLHSPSSNFTDHAINRATKR